jgi:hypothetical protein
VLKRHWYTALWLLLAVALTGGCADDEVTICQGGCPAGKICNFDTGQCVDPRPPDCPADLGRFLSIAVDSTNAVLFSSYTSDFGDLVVGQLDGQGALSCQYVDGAPAVLNGHPDPDMDGDDVGLYSWLALDLLDRPHVAYFDRTNGRLKYAMRSGEGWEVVTVPRRNDNDHVVGRSCSLALDSDGLPHIAFLDETIGALKVARKSTEGRWAIETVPLEDPPEDWPGSLGGEVGRTVSLVLDTKGREWIAFHDVVHGGLKVAGYQTDGDLDQDGNMALAYHDRTSGSLSYAWNQDGSLQKTVVDDGSRPMESGARHIRPVGQHCALAFGHDGLPRIAYLDAGELALKLVAGARKGGFGEPQIVEYEGVVGFYSDLALGPDGLHLASCRFERNEQEVLKGKTLHHEMDGGRTSIGGKK